VNVYAREPVSFHALEVGIEVHEITAQRRETFAMPKKSRQPFELMGRVQSIKQTIFDVRRTPLRETIARSDVPAPDSGRDSEGAEPIRRIRTHGIRRKTLQI